MNISPSTFLFALSRLGFGVRISAFPPTNLLQCVAELKYLSLSFHLPHTQFTAEFHGGWSQSLQSEGAVKTPLTSTPHLVEWNLLEMQKHMMDYKKKKKGGLLNCTRRSMKKEPYVFKCSLLTWYFAISLLFHCMCGTS